MTQDATCQVRLFESFDVLLAKLYIYSANEVLEVLQARRTDDRRVALSHDPSQCHLRHREVEFLRKTFTAIDDSLRRRRVVTFLKGIVLLACRAL